MKTNIQLVSSDLNGTLVHQHTMSDMIRLYIGKEQFEKANEVFKKQTSGTASMEEAFQNAEPKLLEPIFDLEVLVPEDDMGSVMGDLQTRRAIILGMDSQNNFQVIKARVPQSELDKYSTTLRSLSQGRASFRSKLADYAIVPGEIQKKLHEEYEKVDHHEMASH